MYDSLAHRLFKIISLSTQNAQEQEDGIDLPEFYTRTSAKGFVLVCKVYSSCLVYNFPLSEKNGFARFNIQHCVEEIFYRKTFISFNSWLVENNF